MIVRRIVVDDGRTKRDVALVGTITVGRDPACQVSDPDPLLSRRHAEFVATAHEVTIRDLSSRNGVLVNGAKVPERVLVPGDLVQIGRLHCLYIEETAPAPAPTRTAPTPPVVQERTIALMPPLDQAFDEPIAPIPNIPTGNEPTFVPAGWRAEAMQGFDDTQPGGAERRWWPD
jgi:predicted component of type VI protein secretion system